MATWVLMYLLWKILEDKQGRFRRGRRTTDQILSLTIIIDTSKKSKVSTFAAFVDGKGYDFINRNKLCCQIAVWRPNFWPRDLLMQPIRTIWTSLVGDYPGTIPVEFGHIPIGGSKKEVVWAFPYIIQCKIVTPGAGSILTPGA